MYEIAERVLIEQATLVVRDKVAAKDVAHWLMAAFSEISHYMNSMVIQTAGPPTRALFAHGGALRDRGRISYHQACSRRGKA